MDPVSSTSASHPWATHGAYMMAPSYTSSQSISIPQQAQSALYGSSSGLPNPMATNSLQHGISPSAYFSMYPLNSGTYGVAAPSSVSLPSSNMNATSGHNMHHGSYMGHMINTNGNMTGTVADPATTAGMAASQHASSTVFPINLRSTAAGTSGNSTLAVTQMSNVAHHASAQPVPSAPSSTTPSAQSTFQLIASLPCPENMVGTEFFSALAAINAYAMKNWRFDMSTSTAFASYVQKNSANLAHTWAEGEKGKRTVQARIRQFVRRKMLHVVKSEGASVSVGGLYGKDGSRDAEGRDEAGADSGSEDKGTNMIVHREWQNVIDFCTSRRLEPATVIQLLQMQIGNMQQQYQVFHRQQSLSPHQTPVSVPGPQQQVAQMHQQQQNYSHPQFQQPQQPQQALGSQRRSR